MSATRPITNKAVVQRLQDAVNSHDARIISSTIDELVRPDVLIRTPLPVRTTGTEALKEVFARLMSGLPDLHITVEDMVAEGDRVVARNTVSGTHHGEYLGLPPTGRRISYDEIFVFRLADGRIVETWGVVDVLSQLKQLGAMPAPRSAAERH